MSYSSPRWTSEFLDCSLPVTLDTYSACSYRCIYCFSFFQRSLRNVKDKYTRGAYSAVNLDTIKRIFTQPESSQFGEHIRARRAIQWGGLSDQFDEYERKDGKTLELLRFFRSIDYPISFSTKGTWWTKDPRYVELFRGNQNWHVKVSIITPEEEKARKVEVLVDSVAERLAAIERLAKLGIHGVTLRFRPFIIGISSPRHRELIAMAAAAGADSVSTEFLCIEVRSKLARARYESLARIAGIDLFKLYKSGSMGSGYLRLNRDIKRPYIEDMADECAKRGLSFYVSDAHFKELSANGCCCGAKPSFPYSRGHFLEALLIAKREGRVTFDRIAPDLEAVKGFLFRRTQGMNTRSVENRAKFGAFSLRDWVHYMWNDVNAANSPYKYFAGVLTPDGRDAAGDVVYKYTGDKQ
jgi:DNA repair photolyase